MDNTDIDQMVRDALGGLDPAGKEAALESLRRLIDEEACALALDGAASGSVACPRCGSAGFVKRGLDAKGNQRYACRDCGRSFNGSARKILGTTKLPRSTWMRYAKCFVERKTLRDCADECGVSLKTSFFMRHRILEAIAKVQPAFRTGPRCGAQVDEISFRECFKGNHTRSSFSMPRPPRKHGKAPSAAESISVLTGVNDAGDIFYEIASRGPAASRRSLEAALAGAVGEGAVIATDGANAYTGLLEGMGAAEHLVMPSKGHGLNRINCVHARMRGFFAPFRGVATKHLMSYLAWFKWLWSFKWSRSSGEMPAFAMRHIHESTYDTVWREYRNKPLVLFGYWEDKRVSIMG